MFQILKISDVAFTYPVLNDAMFERKMAEYAEQFNQQIEVFAVSISHTPDE